MFSRINAKNFRGLRNATLQGLKRINIITGENGCGKTSLLEAAFLLAGGANATLSVTLSGLRNDTSFSLGSDRIFKGLFRYLDPSLPIELEAEGDFRPKLKKTRRKLKITSIITPQEAPGSTAPTSKISGVKFEFDSPSGKEVGSVEWFANGEATPVRQGGGLTLRPKLGSNPDLINGHFISPFRALWDQAHKLLTDLTKQNKVKDVIEHLRIVDSRLQNLLPLSEDEIKVIYADIGASSLVPVALQGSGFVNVLHIVLDSVSLVDGILIIDEIEDGLHHTVIDKLIQFLFSVSVFNNLQIFVTTHSDEILERFALLAKAKQFDDLSLYRVVRTDEKEQINCYSAEDLISSRETLIELR